MESLYFLKFWRPTSTHKEHGQICNPLVETKDDEYNEGDDSFFELEFSAPDSDKNVTNSKLNATAGNKDNPGSEPHEGDNRLDSKQELLENSAIKTEFPPQTLPVSPTETISKRKVLPIEPITKPQSSISLLKSAPKLRVLLMFRNPKMASYKTEKTRKTERSARQQSKHFSVEFRFEESPNHSVFTKSSASQRKNPVKDESLSYASSRRFSKEVIQRYLNLIKPLYVKVSRRNGEKMKFSGDSSVTSSPASSPATATVCSPRNERQCIMAPGFRTLSKHFGKSKSTSATINAQPSLANRKDVSLLPEEDGIKGAIMHCKRSFNSTRRESSLLSRFASDPLPVSSPDYPRKSGEEN